MKSLIYSTLLALLISGCDCSCDVEQEKFAAPFEGPIIGHYTKYAYTDSKENVTPAEYYIKLQDDYSHYKFWVKVNKDLYDLPYWKRLRFILTKEDLFSPDGYEYSEIRNGDRDYIETIVSKQYTHFHAPVKLKQK